MKVTMYEFMCRREERNGVVDECQNILWTRFNIVYQRGYVGGCLRESMIRTCRMLLS